MCVYFLTVVFLVRSFSLSIFDFLWSFNIAIRFHFVCVFEIKRGVSGGGRRKEAIEAESQKQYGLLLLLFAVINDLRTTKEM